MCIFCVRVASQFSAIFLSLSLHWFGLPLAMAHCANIRSSGHSVLKRCVSALPPAICPLVLRNHLQLSAKRSNRDLSTPIRFPDELLRLGQVNVQQESRDCSAMGSQILREKAKDLDTMFSRIVGNMVQLFSNQTSTQAVSLSQVACAADK